MNILKVEIATSASKPRYDIREYLIEGKYELIEDKYFRIIKLSENSSIVRTDTGHSKPRVGPTSVYFDKIKTRSFEIKDKL